MGIEIKLTDRELPASPVFIDFLHRQISGQNHVVSWNDQISETLLPMDAEGRIRQAQGVAEAVMAHPLGQRGIFRAYELFTALLTGDERRLQAFHDRFRFVVVVGCPRHGGTYVTKQLFRALGHDPEQVPNPIAHDGFPNSAPFHFSAGFNSQTQMLLQAAEYLAMVELWFGNCRPVDGRIVVPKKATKTAYHGGFFRLIFGRDAEYIVTLRHPLAACISTYEKSGGLPQDGRFATRGNIEGWAWRDLEVMGRAAPAPGAMRYIEAYLGYWDYYHRQLADSGLAAASRSWRVVAYGRERLMGLAAQLNRRYGLSDVVEDFEVRRKAERHPDWMQEADAVMRQMAVTWQGRHLPFPLIDLQECW
jgi:hypothetical protein